MVGTSIVIAKFLSYPGEFLRKSSRNRLMMVKMSMRWGLEMALLCYPLVMTNIAMVYIDGP